MNHHQRSALQILSAQTTPKYSSWFLQRRAWAGHYLSEEFTQEILMPMCELGFIKQTKIKNRPVYSITSEGLKALEVPVTPLQVVPPRERPFMEWDGRMQWGPESERGCHPNIGRVGVAC